MSGWTILLAMLPILGGVLLTVWCLAVVLLWWQQERLLFAPERLNATDTLALEPDVHERFVDVPGARLSVLELRLPDPKGVVFFLHGNSANLKQW